MNHHEGNNSTTTVDGISKKASSAQNTKIKHSSSTANATNDDQIIIKIEENLRNMGKSLSCPLCLATLRKPVVLPCLHAFCQECISTHISTIQNNSSKNSSSSSRQISCPICKESCNKRSMVKSPLLEELARKYKEAVRSFGFTPVIYDKNQNVGMTQIEEEVSFSINDDDDDDGNNFSPMMKNKQRVRSKDDGKNENEHDENNEDIHNVIGRKKKRKSKGKQKYFLDDDDEFDLFKKKKTLPPTVRECHEHLEVSRAVHNAFKRVHDHDNSFNGDNDVDTTMTESTTSTNKSTKTAASAKITIEEIERQNQKRKLRALLDDQEKVIKVDEAAIVKAASYTYKKRKSTDDKKKNSGNVVLVIDESNERNKKDENDMSNSKTTIRTTMSKEIGNKIQIQQNDPSYTTNISGITTQCNTNNSNLAKPESSPSVSNIKRAEKELSKFVKLLELPLTEQEFFSQHIDGESQQSMKDDDDNDDNVHEVSKEIGKDRNKRNDVIMTSQEVYEASMDEIRENEVADRSLEEIVEDNTDPKIIQVNQIDKSASSHSKNDNIASQVSEKFFSALSQNPALSSVQENSKDENPKIGDEERSAIFPIGTIVDVQARTWPGVNKPGGTARITKIHSQSGGNNVQYDVVYILGGKEKMVDDAFISIPKNDNANDDINAMALKTDESITGAKSADTSRKSRRVGERKKVERWIQEIDAKLEEEAKMKKRKPRSTQSSANPVEELPDSKDSGKESSKVSKKRTRSSDQLIVENTKPPSPTEAAKQKGSKLVTNTLQSEVTNDLTFSQLKKLAMKRCNKLLLDDTLKKLNIITSSLSKEDEKLVKNFCSKLSTKKVKVKVLNDFNAEKSNICITTPSEHDPIQSKLRTVKAMRASLAAVPILSPEWLLYCIEHNSIKEPEEHMYIQTLPTKEDMYMKSITDNSIRNKTARGGVFAIAAQYMKEGEGKTNTCFHLFENIYVYLCGDGWKKSNAKTKDVHLLLKEGGANILTSASVVTKTLTNGLKPGSTFVLLCDGSISATNSSFPANLKQAVENTVNDDKDSALIVNSKWLFDCISCAEILGAKQYQPEGTIVKTLWQGTMKT